MRSTLNSDKGNTETHENQGGIEILVVILHVLGVVLHRLSFVHGVEIELVVSFLIGWRYIRRASWMLFVVNLVLAQSCINKTHHLGSMLTGFSFSSPLIVVSFRWVDGRVEEP